MNTIHIRIGEHSVRVASDSAKLMNTFNKNFQALPIPALHNGLPDMVIQLTEGYGDTFVNYEVEIVKSASAITFQRADYLIESNPDYTHSHIRVHDEIALKHALINLYSSYIVHNNWGLLIHSSCVLEDGKAHMFAGQSGAGKSTAAMLSYPRELLSDEAALVKIAADGITVFNSPFRSELELNGTIEYGPLASVNLLYQACDNQRIILKKSSGLLHLLDKVFYWAHDAKETGKIIGLLKLLADAVPIYELHFQKNDTFWELIS